MKIRMWPVVITIGVVASIASMAVLYFVDRAASRSGAGQEIMIVLSVVIVAFLIFIGGFLYSRGNHSN